MLLYTTITNYFDRRVRVSRVRRNPRAIIMSPVDLDAFMIIEVDGIRVLLMEEAERASIHPWSRVLKAKSEFFDINREEPWPVSVSINISE